MTKSKRNPSGARAKTKARSTGAGAAPKRAPKPSRALASSKTEVCSIADPFCEHALSAKYHDDGSVRTLPFPHRTRTILSTNAIGAASILIVPSFLYEPWTNASAIVGDAASYGGVARNPITTFNAGAVRLVSYGVVVRSIVAPLSASGMVRVRTYATRDIPALVSGANMSGYNADSSSDVPLFAAKEVALIGRRLDNTAKLFKTPLSLDSTAFVTDNSGSGFGPIIVSVTGAPATTAVLDVEFILHWEITLADNDPLQQITTASRPQNLVVEAASRAISTSSQNVFTMGISAATTYVEKMAAKAIGSYFGVAPLALLAG